MEIDILTLFPEMFKGPFKVVELHHLNNPASLSALVVCCNVLVA